MNDKVEKTEEQLKAEADAKAKAKAEAKAAKDKQKAEAKAARETAKAEAKVAKEKAKEDKAAAKVKALEEAKKAKEASKMEERNGVRRPKPATLCGQAWAIFDAVSQETGVPAAIGPSMERAKAKGFNEGNVRAEYARWRKFHGITGRQTTAKATEGEQTPA